MQHDSHVLAFHIQAVRHELATTVYRSADDYYDARDFLRRLEAKAANKTVLQHDPMGFWFGRQSN